MDVLSSGPPCRTLRQGKQGRFRKRKKQAPSTQQGVDGASQKFTRGLLDCVKEHACYSKSNGRGEMTGGEVTG